MHVCPTQPIRGREAGVLGANLGDQLVLLALEPFKTGLILRQALEEPTDQGAEPGYHPFTTATGVSFTTFFPIPAASTTSTTFATSL